MERYVDGPPIPGTSIPYWLLKQQRLYETRPKPTDAFSLITNPTWLLSSHSRTVNVPATDSLGWVGAPDVVIDFSDTRIPWSYYVKLKALTANKLRGKIKGEKWNLSTFMGELPTTLKYFRSALSEIVQVYLSVKKGDLRSIKRLAKRGKRWLKRRGLAGSVKDVGGSVSKRWLEFRYAVSPLVYDFQDMLSYLYRASVRPIISRAASGAEITYSKKIAGGAYGSDVYDRYTMKGRGVAYFSVNPHAEAFKQLGLINLAATLWELTPLSFVADMFLPIGDRIAHLDAMAGVDLLSGTYSVSISGTAHATLKRIVYPNTDPPFSRTTGSSQCETRWYQREPGVGFVVVPPTYSEHPSVKQTLDLIALTRTMLFK